MSDDSDSPIKNLNLHQIQIKPKGLRFMVLHLVRGRYVKVDEVDEVTHEWFPNTEPLYEVYGAPSKPSVFKTLKNAFKVARKRFYWITEKDIESSPDPDRFRLTTSKVVVFDPNYLPLVAADDKLFEMPAEADKLTEAEFCERQIGLWYDLHERALEREKKPPEVRCGARKAKHGPGEGCVLPPGHLGGHQYNDTSIDSDPS